MDAKKHVKNHFRLLSLLVLSALIFLVSLTTTQLPENLHFRTYELNIAGSGGMGTVAIELNFSSDEYTLECLLQPGNYSIYGNMEFDAFAGGVSCNATKDCSMEVRTPSKLDVFFDKKEMLPSGNFQFYFTNDTEMEFMMDFGKKYSFYEVKSMFPRKLHGSYSPDAEVLKMVTFKRKKQTTDYMSVDVYAINQLNRDVNQENEWRKDFIVVPLAIALVMLLVSDALDYAHKYVKRR